MSKLLDRLKKELSNGFPFMDGKEKVAVTLDTEMTIEEYGFMTGKDGDFVVFTVKGNDKEFFFGGSVLTQKLKDMEAIFTQEEIAQILVEGLTIKMSEKKSKASGRNYVNVEIV